MKWDQEMIRQWEIFWYINKYDWHCKNAAKYDKDDNDKAEHGTIYRSGDLGSAVEVDNDDDVEEVVADLEECGSEMRPLQRNERDKEDVFSSPKVMLARKRKAYVNSDEGVSPAKEGTEAVVCENNNGDDSNDKVVGGEISNKEANVAVADEGDTTTNQWDISRYGLWGHAYSNL